MHYKHFSKDFISIHAWRQTQTQSTIINFYEEDMNIFNPRRNDRGSGNGIFRMEFPLMQWTAAVLYKIFGNNLIITRAFMFLTGLISVIGIYKLLIILFNKEILAIMGAWAFNFSPAFYYYTINPLPDNLALCLSIWGFYLFFKWYNTKNIKHLVLCGLCLSLSTLCKLPFIVFFTIPFVYFVRQFTHKGFKRNLTIQAFSVLSWGLLPIAWYVAAIPQWDGNPVVKGMLNNKQSFSILLDYLQHNLISTLPELLLNYGSLPMFLAGFYFIIKHKSYKKERFFYSISLCIAVLIYFIFELNAIAKVHDYYLFPFLPLIFLLVGYGAFYLYQSKKKYVKIITLILLLTLPFTCYLRMKNRWNLNSPGFNKDLLIYKKEIRQRVPKDALVVAGNDNSHFIMFYYIDKKGWGFQDDKLSSQALAGMIKEGAEYLYTDSEQVISKNNLHVYLDKLILEKGTIRIYKLKSN